MIRMTRRVASTAGILALVVAVGCSAPPLPGESEIGTGDYNGAARTIAQRLDSGAYDEVEEARARTLLAWASGLSGDRGRADELFAAIESSDAPELIKTQARVYRGLVVTEAGDLDGAGELLRQAESELQALGEGRSVAFGLCLSGLGVLDALRGDAAGGEQQLVRAVPILKRYRKTYPAHYAGAASNLATLLVTRKAFEGAQRHYESALDSLRDAGGGPSVELGNTLNGLAYTEYQAANYTDAERHLLEAVEVFSEVEGDESSNVAKCYHDLAKVYQFTGNFEGAEEAYRTSYELYWTAFGQEHPYAQQALASASEFLKEQGKSEVTQAWIAEFDATADATPEDAVSE